MVLICIFFFRDEFYSDDKDSFAWDVPVQFDFIRLYVPNIRMHYASIFVRIAIYTYFP